VGFVGEGVREINLISQDTTYYGMDLWEAKAGELVPPRDAARQRWGISRSRARPLSAACIRSNSTDESNAWISVDAASP